MLATSGALPRYYQPERAVAADESVLWVVVDEDFGLHVEASAYLARLRGADRAFNTEKTYAGRIALYLSYRLGHGVDWSNPSLAQPMGMMRRLVDESTRSRRPGARARCLSEGTANAIMGTVGEFLSWCCLQNLPQQDRQSLAELINQFAHQEIHLTAWEAPETMGLLV
ncbi:hypothetical protein [Streptosporangium sp. CA-115845]|uniref:hypothetical protein n=1 Tax=Streptosporangium sp. CA-115845 TaxID=3240071 RepID=UPI003D8C09E7